MARKSRNETNCRNVSSKDGSFTPHIPKETANRITRYCKITNQNKTKFVDKCMKECLDALEREILGNLSKEELIDLLIKKEGF